MAFSFKGFLSPRASDQLPRMTAAHKDAVMHAVSAALNCACDTGAISAEQFSEAGDVMSRALAVYPNDRSCRTCDFFGEGPDHHCNRWGQVVPTLDAVEAGCKEHQEHEVPF